MSSEKKFWWQNAKIYELYVDKFAKDFKGLTHNIDYFGILGVNTLHILPHYRSPMIDDGYDISDYRGVREDLGTIEDFKVFLETARAKGLRVILDLVINHTSDQHPWFVEARSSKNNPKRDYYLWSDTGSEFAEAANAFPTIKPHNWISNTATGDYYFATFYPAQPDLNWGNPAVFNEMVSIMEYWAAMGVNGFRIDAAAHLIKKEGTTSRDLPETHEILKRIRARLEKNYPEVILLAEASGDSKKYFGDGDECHMVYHFPLMREMWIALMTGDESRLEVLKNEMVDIPTNCAWATFLRNHDEINLRGIDPVVHAELLKLLDPEARFMLDQDPAVRIGSVFGSDQEKILTAFRMLYSSHGSPIMYYGDEIGTRNLAPVQGIQDARKYVRGDFDWAEASRQMKEPTSLFNKTAAIIHGPVVLKTEEAPLTA